MSRPLRLVPQAAQPVEFVCPLCAGVHAAYIFGTSQFRVFRCGGCGLTFSKPKRNTEPCAQERRPDRSAEDHAALLAALGAAAVSGPVLLVAGADDALIPLLVARSVQVVRVAAGEDFAGADWRQTFSAAIVSEALMRVADPRSALMKIRRHLAPGAPLLLSIPLLDGRQARLMGRHWHEWQSGNLWFFTRETLNLLLLASGFEQVWFRPERRSYSLDQLSERMHGSAEAASWLNRVESVRRFLPRGLTRRPFRLPSGTVVVSAAAAPARTECVVSIVVPVFNEAATCRALLDALLAKDLPGLRKEIIVVESNSTDGSRDLVRAYEGEPDVRVVLQDAPRGKGNAVREGLSLATGDIVMIQDADLEYDLDDYDGLLAPLVAWQSMFILGSRHQGGWKMRKFHGAPIAAAVFNAGHWFFKSLMNVVLSTRMTDPFTMFKVFRRDALFGLDFICNRFDFDIELVIKLVRKGYVPVELPVNYRSRSFAEGKKVSVTRDGMTWVWTILKLRVLPIGAAHHADDALNYFITGVAGFIGSQLADRLLATGAHVTGYDNLSTGQMRFLDGACANPNFRFVKGDLLDTAALSGAMAGAEFVFHLAANADVRFGTEHPERDLQQNTIATFNVLEAMRANNVKRLAFSSTGSIYGEPQVFPTPEDAPFPIQTSLYGASKLAAEGMIAAYCEGFGFQGTIFRFVSILGERYTHGHVFDFVQKLAADPTRLHVLGNGKQRKSYLYVHDCIDAMLLAIEKADGKINVFNLGNDEANEVNASIGWIVQRLGMQPALTYAGGERGWIGDSPFILLDTRRIRALGWKPKLTIRQGIERTVDWLTANCWVFEQRT